MRQETTTIPVRLLALALSVSAVTQPWVPHADAAGRQNKTKLGTLDVDLIRPQWYVQDKEIERSARRLFTEQKFSDLEALGEACRHRIPAYPNGLTQLGAFRKALTKPADYDQQFKLLDAWLKAKPNSSLASAVYADNLVDWAWDARGTGYSQTVSDRAHNLMQERLSRARKMLEQVKDRSKRVPIWYSAMQTVALGQGWEKDEYMRLFQEAIESYPEYCPFYFNAVYYLQPRWYGDEHEWEQFAAREADRLGGSSGDVLYARIVWNVHRDMGDDNLRKSSFDYQRAKKGLLAISGQYPQDLSARSELAWLATMRNDIETARKIFLDLDSKVAINVWEDKKKFFELRKIALEE